MPAPGYPRPEYSYPSDYNQTIEEIIKQRDEAIAERDVARNCAEHWEKLCDDARQVACEQYTALLKCEGYRHSYQVEAEYQEQRALKAEHDERQFHQMWIKADAEWEKAAQERDETGYQLIEAKGDITFHKYLAGEWRDACFKADANSAELVEGMDAWRDQAITLTGQNAELVEGMEKVMLELGGYADKNTLHNLTPAPVANAVRIIKATLASVNKDKCE